MTTSVPSPVADQPRRRSQRRLGAVSRGSPGRWSVHPEHDGVIDHVRGDRGDQQPGALEGPGRERARATKTGSSGDRWMHDGENGRARQNRNSHRRRAAQPAENEAAEDEFARTAGAAPTANTASHQPESTGSFAVCSFNCLQRGNERDRFQYPSCAKGSRDQPGANPEPDGARPRRGTPRAAPQNHRGEGRRAPSSARMCKARRVAVIAPAMTKARTSASRGGASAISATIVASRYPGRRRQARPRARRRVGISRRRRRAHGIEQKGRAVAHLLPRARRRAGRRGRPDRAASTLMCGIEGVGLHRGPMSM